MKKVLFLVAVMMVFGAVAAQAATVTLTFDDIPAWNSAPPYVGEEWADLGIHFTSLFTVNPPTQDGGLYDSGMLAGLTVDGTQYVGVSSSTGNCGLIIMFDTDQTSVSFQYDATASRTGMIWAFNDGENTYGEPTFFSLNGGTKTVSGLGPFDTLLICGNLATTPQNVAFDNFTFNAVPIPASILLLGTGLVPLLGFRRKR